MLAPDDPVPAELHHPAFLAVPLSPQVAALDHAAYVASPEVIRVHSDGRWPVDGFTVEQDREQVEQHHRDHQAHRSFAFTLLAPSREEALGCLYLNPLRDYLQRTGSGAQQLAAFPARSAMVTFWLRQDQQDTGLATAVVAAVAAWLRDDWPLERCLFRVLPAERTSRRALEAGGLRPVTLDLPREPRPYLWFETQASSV